MSMNLEKHTHTLYAHTHIHILPPGKREVVFAKRNRREEVDLQREAARVRELAPLEYVTHASLALCPSFSLSLSLSPSQPRMTLSAVVIRSVSREGPDSEEMGEKGVPLGRRGVCVMCKACS